MRSVEEIATEAVENYKDDIRPVILDVRTLLEHLLLFTDNLLGSRIDDAIARLNKMDL